MVLSKKAQSITPSLTLKIDAKSKKMKAEGLDVIGFGAGEPDFDTPEYIKDAAKEALDKGFTKYTAATGTPELKKAACKRYLDKYGLVYDAKNCVVSNGAKHSLFNVLQAILNPGDEVVIIKPFWLSYSELVKMADGVPVFAEAYEKDMFLPKPEAIEAAVTDRTKAIIVNSPSNPTGAVYDKELLEGIADIAKKHDLFIISDEIYDELVYGAEQTSIACISEDAKTRTIIVNGMSKAYAMTGWRIGYILCDERIVSVISGFQSNSTSNPCSIAQYASVAALANGEKELVEMQRTFKNRRDLIYGLIEDIPLLSCAEPQGAFYVFVNIGNTIGKSYKGKEITDALSFADILLAEKLVAVVPGTPFGAEGYIRLSYACSEQSIDRGLARIAEFCAELE